MELDHWRDDLYLDQEVACIANILYSGTIFPIEPI